MLLSPFRPGRATVGLALALLAAPVAVSAQTLKVSSFARSGDQLRLTIEDSGSSTSYELQGSPAMAAGTWSTVTAPYTAVSARSGYFTIPATAGGARFFRVIAYSGTADDTDGDGLANSYETGFKHTNPNIFDTDSDGFGDGQEVVYGTDPLNSASKPVFSAKPAVEFAELVGNAVEGGTQTVKLVFDRPFSGPVKYRVVTDNSTVTPADYAPLEGVTQVSGTEGAIVVRWTDDWELKPDRMLALDVVAGESDPYRTGGRSRHIIRLAGNDAWWTGSAADAYAQRNFRVKLARNAAGLQASFGAGPVHDGLPLLTGEAAADRTSQTEGLIPAGTFAATVRFDTATRFEITSPPMPLPAGGLAGAAGQLTRTVTLESNPAGNPAHFMEPARIIGSYTERLESVASPHLNRVFTGVFVILRDLPTPMTLPAQ